MTARENRPKPRGRPRNVEERDRESPVAPVAIPFASSVPAEPAFALVLSPVPAETCGAYTILQLCEQAHWDIIGEGLCLSDWDPKAKAKEIRGHLKECPDCARWYRNARRAYEKLGDDVESVLPEPCFLTPPQPREAVLSSAAEDDNAVLLELKPKDGPGLLDKCTIHLEWERKHDKLVSPRWSVTVKLMSKETGNDEQTLKKLSGSSVLLERQVPGLPDPEHILTRLDFDSAKNLASIPRDTEVANPKADLETTRFTLTLLDWGKETGSD